MSRTTITTARRDRGGRSPGIACATVAVAIVVAVAALTLTSAQAAPPAIAEIAPSAVQQIKDAPAEQSSESGAGEGGTGAGGLTTTTSGAGAAGAGPLAPSTTAAGGETIERARVRRCVGNPPRQTEDPQSPPCVPYWSGGNGGATSRGVTGDEVVVVVPELGGAPSRLETYFNKRFELYGRKLRLKQLVTGGTCEAVKAGAAQAQDELGAFASTSILKMENCYMGELARRKMIGASDDSVFTAAELQRQHPYLWYYTPPLDALMTELGQWACNRFAGRNARYADGVNAVTGLPMAQSKRVFGLIVQPFATGHPVDVAPMERALAACGERLARSFTYPDDDLVGTNASRQAAVQMQTAGVTTVLCLCGSFSNLFLPAAASSQSWYPEWLASSYNHNDSNINIKNYWPDAQQRANLLVLTQRPRQWTFADTPLMWAIREADPSFNEKAENATIYEGQWKKLYHWLLIIASGIQLAGPNLTPETFAAGLQRASFPNPATGLVAGRVGFGGGSHTMTIDTAEAYWSEAPPGPYDDGPGTLCWVDGGARRSRGQYPATDVGFFGLPCDAGTQRAQDPT